MTFTEFTGRRLDELLRFATALTSDRGLGEDLVQDVLIRAQARWDRIETYDVPYLYVRRMIINAFVSWRRKWSRVVPRSDLVELAGAADGPDHAERHAERDALIRDIAGLPRRQRTVIILRFYEELSDPEIADLLGCTTSTVRGYAMRALRTLRVEREREPTGQPVRQIATDGRTN